MKQKFKRHLRGLSSLQGLFVRMVARAIPLVVVAVNGAGRDLRAASGTQLSRWLPGARLRRQS